MDNSDKEKFFASESWSMNRLKVVFLGVMIVNVVVAAIFTVTIWLPLYRRHNSVKDSTPAYEDFDELPQELREYDVEFEAYDMNPDYRNRTADVSDASSSAEEPAKDYCEGRCESFEFCRKFRGVHQCMCYTNVFINSTVVTCDHNNFSDISSGVLDILERRMAGNSTNNNTSSFITKKRNMVLWNLKYLFRSSSANETEDESDQTKNIRGQ